MKTSAGSSASRFADGSGVYGGVAEGNTRNNMGSFTPACPRFGASGGYGMFKTRKMGTDASPSGFPFD
jgi:hypothetical protein